MYTVLCSSQDMLRCLGSPLNKIFVYDKCRYHDRMLNHLLLILRQSTYPDIVHFQPTHTNKFTSQCNWSLIYIYTYCQDVNSIKTGQQH